MESLTIRAKEMEINGVGDGILVINEAIWDHGYHDHTFSISNKQGHHKKLFIISTRLILS